MVIYKYKYIYIYIFIELYSFTLCEKESKPMKMAIFIGSYLHLRLSIVKIYTWLSCVLGKGKAIFLGRPKKLNEKENKIRDLD